MIAAGQLSGRTTRLALGAMALVGMFSGMSAGAQTQAPYLLPYTIQSLAGGGTAPAVGATCTGTNGVTGTAYDTQGDGCPVSSSSVLTGTGADIHDVVVDQQGNLYFIDNLSNGVVRRIDARSGIVTVYAGTPSSVQPVAGCPTTVDEYGDGCTANDGHGNVPPPTTTPATPYLYTTDLAKARGLGIARNGDLYIADYNGNVIHRISLQTGLMTIEAGFVTGGTVTKPTGNKGTKGYTGDGGQANGAEEGNARGVGVDAQGNVYIADTANNVIRKVTAATGIINTIAGSTAATAGSTGDGGPASAALLSGPEDVQVDNSGDIFIADFGNAKIRVIYEGGANAAKMITANGGGTPAIGFIYTVMGGGTALYASEPAVFPATAIALGSPRKIWLDARGNLYVADNTNYVIWFEDATTGYQRDLAGTFGTATAGTDCAGKTDAFGDSCPATQATLNPNSAMGVAVDAFGAVYISDSGDMRIRKVRTNQSFASLALNASASQILDVHFAAGDGPAANGFVVTGSKDFTAGAPSCTTNADTTQDCLVTVTFAPTAPGPDVANVTVSSTANGTAIFGLSGVGVAPALALDPGATAAVGSGLKAPAGVVVDAAGNTYVADAGNNRVVKITAAGVQTVFAGTGTSGYTGDGGQAAAATLNGPKAVAVARNGAIYIADTGNNVVRQVNPATGVITTFGGGGAALCAQPIDSVGDGCPATMATFNAPAGLAADISGNIYVSDTGNSLLRELTLGGYSIRIGGGGANCSAGDTFGNGCLVSQAIFNGLTGLALDSNLNLYVADTGDNEVREVTAANTVVRLTGNGAAGGGGNGGTATNAGVSAPSGVGVDAAGNVYIADTGNSAVRVINGSGNINTVVGTLGSPGAGTLPGSAANTLLSSPMGVAVTGAGNLVIADTGNNRAVSDTRSVVSYDFGKTDLGSSSPTLQITQTSTGNLATVLGMFTESGATTSLSVTPTGSDGCEPSTPLTPGSFCLLAAMFTPQALGQVTATYSESSTSPVVSPAPVIQLTGTGAVLTPTTTTTAVTSAGTPQYSVPFTVTATITPSSCNPADPACSPTGTVTFFVDGNQVGTPATVAAGQASAQISGLAVGTHQIVAVYSGDSNYGSSTAANLTVTIAQGSTMTTVTATPSNVPQFQLVTLTAKVTTAIANTFPTGTVKFYAGTTQLITAEQNASVSVNATTGIATLTNYVPPVAPATVGTYTSFGLPAGTYAITAVYSGDANYAASTSAAFTLTIAADAQTIGVSTTPATTGTAQGSTALTFVTLTPSNTLNGTVTLACSGLPQYSDCTFSPTSTVFTPVALGAATTSVQVTLFTDVQPDVIPSTSTRAIVPGLFGQGRGETLAATLGWPVLLLSLGGMIGLRRKLRSTRLLTALALFGVLAGSSLVMSGCGSGSSSSSAMALTPPGTYTVTITANGPGGVTGATTFAFTVTQGASGQE